MKKKSFYLLLILSVFVYACEKDAITDSGNENANDSTHVEDSTSTTNESTIEDSIEENSCDTTISYENGIKRIVDHSCAVTGCHTQGYAHGDFSTYSAMGTSIQDTTKSFYQRVVVQKNMPVGGYTITEEQIDSIACWIKNGSKEN